MATAALCNAPRLVHKTGMPKQRVHIFGRAGPVRAQKGVATGSPRSCHMAHGIEKHVYAAENLSHARRVFRGRKRKIAEDGLRTDAVDGQRVCEQYLARHS